MTSSLCAPPNWLRSFTVVGSLLASVGCSSEQTEKPPIATPEPSSTPDSGTEADAGGFDQCAAAAINANPIPASLLFLLDRSGSMNCVAPDGDEQEATLCKTDPRKRGSGPSKWEITTQALTSALEALGTRENVSVGFSLFPMEGTQCDVPATPNLELTNTGESMLASMNDILGDAKPEGETPIAGSTILGYAHLSEQLRERKIYGNTYLVLMTDGNETCKPTELDKLLETDVPLAREGFGIRTFVIGAPGSEDARALLSKIAYLGGTGASDCDHGDDNDTANCHFDMTRSTHFSEDLEAVFAQIAEAKALSCEFQVPRSLDGSGVDLSEVNVSFLETPESDSVTIGMHPGAPGSCTDKEAGWTYSADTKKILLCGKTCTAAEQAPEGRVEIILGCPTQVAPMLF